MTRPEGDFGTFLGGLAAALLRIDFPGLSLLAGSRPSKGERAVVHKALR